MKLRWIAVPLVFAGALAAAHVYEAIRGVHFKSESDRVDFGLPPARFANRMSTQSVSGIWRPGTTYLGGDYSYWWRDEEETYSDKRSRLEERRERELVAAYQKGQRFEMRDDRAGATALYRRMLQRGQGDVGFLRGRIDLYREVGSGPVAGLSDFLHATAWRFDARAKLPVKADAKLAPFVAYEAALRRKERVELLRQVAQTYPQSSRAPAALMMAVRALIQGNRKQVDERDLRQAEEVLHALQTRYPNSRFAWSARGGFGRIAFLRQDYPEALRHYRLQLKTANGSAQEWTALNSIYLCAKALGNKPAMAESLIALLPRARERMDIVVRLQSLLANFEAKDARQLGERLKRDPRLLTEYLEFRLDFTKPSRDLYGFTSAKGISGLALARLANAALALRDGPRAKEFAAKALVRPEDRDSHAMATFVRASLDRRSGRLSAARAGYASILRRWPKSYLVGGARENLALLNERFGDLAGALDQYVALNYHDDVAYLSDIRMTPGQLETYTLSRPSPLYRKELIYTLGMRYLRERNWVGAERAFARLSVRDRRQMTGWDWHEGGLQDPSATLKALRKLDAKVRAAKGRNAKAAALFATGDYYYRHRSLLLYSAPAWRGVRSEVIAYSWNQRVALPADDRALDRHHEEHEAVAQALRYFRRVVRDYPETPSAPQAAYWGASAAHRLSDYNDYWRWKDQDAHLMGEAVRLMRFAQRAKNPTMAQRARKYLRIFRDDYTRARMAFAKEKAPARRFESWSYEQ